MSPLGPLKMVDLNHLEASPTDLDLMVLEGRAGSIRTVIFSLPPRIGTVARTIKLRVINEDALIVGSTTAANHRSPPASTLAAVDLNAPCPPVSSSAQSCLHPGCITRATMAIRKARLTPRVYPFRYRIFSHTAFTTNQAGRMGAWGTA